jgi:hypothetical protein
MYHKRKCHNYKYLLAVTRIAPYTLKTPTQFQKLSDIRRYFITSSKH